MSKTTWSLNLHSLTAEQVSVEIDPLTLGLISIRNKNTLSALGEIKVPDTFLDNTQEYHPQGLFSSAIFGMQGTPARMANLGYISLNTDIIIPDVYTQLIKARGMYDDIMRGRLYAKFDPVTTDFVVTPVEDGGQTGYTYFMSYLDKLSPMDTGASTRKRLLKLLEKHKGKLITRYYLVIPAGYRDIEQTQDGRIKSDEINELYMRLLRSCSFITADGANFDVFRYQTQAAVNGISDYIDSILYGKSGLINSKFSKRGVNQGTRNVITSQLHEVIDLDSASNLNLMDATIGMPQTVALFPDKILFHIKQLLTPIMPDIGYEFTVINPVNYKAMEVDFDADLYNLFMTASGFTQLMKIIRVKDNRLKTLKVGKYWLGGIYKPPGYVQIISDPKQIEGFQKEYLHPITIVELFYLAIMQMEETLVGTATRPPVLGKGGISQNPFRPYFTDPYEIREEIGTGHVGGRYPIIEYKYVDGTLDQEVSLNGTFNDSFTVSELKYIAYSSDNDGDALSAIPITTDEAVEEIHDSLQKANTYLTPNGDLLYGLAEVGVANNILLTITG